MTEHVTMAEASGRERFAPFTHLLAVMVWLSVSVVWPAIVRLVHGFPRLRGGETGARLTTRDGVVLRGSYAAGRSPRAVLLVHGYADGRGCWNGWAGALEESGVHVARFDHRAHGASGGRIVTFADREVDDVIEMVRWLRQQSGVEHISILATSMGAGAAMAATPHLRALGVDRLVLLAPACDYRAIATDVSSEKTLRRLAPFAAAFARRFERRSFIELAPREHIGDAPLPTLVFHSRDDELIAARHTLALAEAFPSFRVEWLDKVRHAAMPRAVLERRREQALEALGVDATPRPP